MAMGNLNKSKETKPTTTTDSIKVGIIHCSQKLKSSLSHQNLLSEITSKCEDCAARFTS
jgi:hypothetical protein